MYENLGPERPPPTWMGLASPRLTQSGSGCTIAAHVLDKIANSGFNPCLFITDRASTEIKGPLERLIKDLNLIINHANWEDLKRQQTQATERFRKESREVDKENNNDQVDYNDKTVHELTTRERILQIKDVKENMKPPLTNLIRTHNPTSYLTMHPQTGTPLGKMDVIRRQLKEAVRMEIASKPLRSDGPTIELMVKA